MSNDILQNWDTTYSLDHFDTCKNFDGPVDKECNSSIPQEKFEQIPLIKKLVDTFTEMLPSLTIDLVWLIIKNKPGIGFQSWHRDFYLEMSKITKTVVINLGVTKRSDLLGRSCCVFINSDKKGNSNNEGNVSAAKGNNRKANDKPHNYQNWI